MRVYSGDEALALTSEERQAAADDLAQSVALHHGWSDRAARILAVERGLPSAPAGWYRRPCTTEWSKDLRPGHRAHVSRHLDRDWISEWVAEWEFQGARRPDEREWPTALEAMEAIDKAYAEAQSQRPVGELPVMPSADTHRRR